MIGFGIDETQAEYVAEIKLRHLNREYILKRTQEIAQLEEDIARLEGIWPLRPRSSPSSWESWRPWPRSTASPGAP